MSLYALRILSLEPRGSNVFQYENAYAQSKVDKGRVCQGWSGWPAQSHDRNPTEHRRDELDR